MPSDIHKFDHDLLTIHDLIEWKPPPTQHIIWDGVLDVGGKLQIFGNEGSWKPASALHMAYAVATGRRWFGFRTSPANVIYILAEGGRAAIRHRAIKYCEGTKAIYLAKPDKVPNESQRATNISQPGNVVVRYVDTLHLDEQSGIASLRKNIDTLIMHCPNLPILVIVDPLYRMFHRDLTVAKDMSQFIENIDILLTDYNEIRQGYQRQLAIMVVHHSRKAGADKDGVIVTHGSDESFGTKELSWWFDTILNINLEEKDATRTLINGEFTKYGRNTEGYLPEFIQLRWDKSTLHPLITVRRMPSIPEDEVELRGQSLLERLE